jgi:hypothetical protein
MDLTVESIDLNLQQKLYANPCDIICSHEEFKTS